MNSVYFSEQGLTSTSANYIANLAKEYVAKLKESLQNISFVDSEIALVGSDFTPIGYGINELSFVDKYLQQIVQAYSLIAWLREAIKEKDAEKRKIEQLTVREWCEEYPDIPEQPIFLTEEDVISKWSVKERNKYLTLSTIVSVYGKFIHPDGAFSVARKKLQEISAKPISYSENGRDTLITRSSPSLAVSEVETKFIQLQSEWRKAQAELNSYKHQIQQTIDEDTSNKNAAYEKACQAYRTKSLIIDAKFETYKTNKLKEIADLKIVIPNDLKDIYNLVK